MEQHTNSDEEIDLQEHNYERPRDCDGSVIGLSQPLSSRTYTHSKDLNHDWIDYDSTSNKCECVCFWLYTTTEHGDLIIHAALAKAKPSEPRLGNEKEEKLLLAHEFWFLQKEQDFVWFVTEHWSQVFVQCAHSRLLRHVQYVSSPLD